LDFDVRFAIQPKQGAILTSKISGVGWLTVIILLLFCFPIFWLGFFIKEDIYYCKSCRMKIG
jgi:hypothetical protein